MVDTAETMRPSQAPGRSMPQDCRTLEDRQEGDSAAADDLLNQYDLKQQL